MRKGCFGADRCLAPHDVEGSNQGGKTLFNQIKRRILCGDLKLHASLCNFTG